MARLVVGALIFSLLTPGCGGGGGPSSSGSETISGTTTFNVTSAGAPSAYTINSFSNPILVVQRGLSYTFNLSASGHPFFIMTFPGTNTANAYTNGVTGNGNSTGVLTFVVPANAPDSLYYNCSIHSGMSGIIQVRN